MSRSHRRTVVLLLLAALLPLGAFALAASVAVFSAHEAAEAARLTGAARLVAAAVDARLAGYIGVLDGLAGTLLSDEVQTEAGFEQRAAAAGSRLGAAVALLRPGQGQPALVPFGSAPVGTAPVSAAVMQDWARSLASMLREGRPGLFSLGIAPGGDAATLAAAVPLVRPGVPDLALVLLFDGQTLRDVMAPHLPARTLAVVLTDPADRPVAARPGPEAQLPSRAAEATATVGLLHAPGWALTLRAIPDPATASPWPVARWGLIGGLLFGIGMALATLVMRHEALREAGALQAGRAQMERLHGGLPAVIFLSEVAPGGAVRHLYVGGDVGTVTGWASGSAMPATQGGAAEPDWQPWTREVCRAVVDHGTATAERQLRRPDGSRVTLETTARMLEALPGGGALVVGYVVDITIRRDAERRAMLAERLASLGEMAAGFAHEVKQPLLAMSLAAELATMALERTDSAEARRLLDSIVERAHRTSDMIDRLRRFARGSGEKAATEDVPLGTAIEGGLALLQVALAEAGIAVELALGDPPPIVRGQAMLLEQVLSNLVMNARDQMAGRPREMPRRIRISAAHCDGGRVALRIADTGGGIAPMVMERLFEPFVTTKGIANGTGLGLSICRGLIGAMGGTIEAHNEEAGAVFTILLQASAGPPANQHRLPAAAAA